VLILLDARGITLFLAADFLGPREYDEGGGVQPHY
jgi:hypothetical protein